MEIQKSRTSHDTKRQNILSRMELWGAALLKKLLDFCSPIEYYNYGLQKRGDKNVPKNRTANRKSKGKPIHVRLDERTNVVLETYAEQEQVSRAEAIRRGIMKLEPEIKK